MTEENVTRRILEWLMTTDWEIVCFDFPQSGTGRFLHPNGAREKNKDSINPDIVAVRENICVFFENKDRFYYPDFQKIHKLITTNDYSEAIDGLLKKHKIDKIYYGIGFPANAHGKKSREAEMLVDFIVGVNADGSISILHSKEGLIHPFHEKSSC